MAPPHILIFTKTLGYRHDSIPIAAKVVADWGNNTSAWTSVHTEDSSVFTDEDLSKFDAMAWISATGEVLNTEQMAAFEKWLQRGGHFAAIHAATCALEDSTVYGALTGGQFSWHPKITNASYKIECHDHPASSMLPDPWQHYDEVYQFRKDPRALNVNLLLSAIPTSYSTISSGDSVPPSGLTPGGPPQPIAWYREPGYSLSPSVVHNGRMFQTGLGHGSDIWLYDRHFRNHIWGGMNWVIGNNSATLTAPDSNGTATDDQK